MNRIPFIILFLLLSCAASFGQSSYEGLMPGRSTRADVERVLGRPLKVVQELLVEYKSPEEGVKLYVQYVDGSSAAIVDRTELTCLRPSDKNPCAGTAWYKFGRSVSDVEFDVRVHEQGGDHDKWTVYFGAPRFLVFELIERPGLAFEFRMALMSPEPYKDAVPKGGCTGTIFGTWETAPFISSNPKDFTQDYINLGRVTIKKVGDDGIKGTYQNNGTLTLRRARQNDEDFIWRNNTYKGEWRDDTGGGTIEIEVESRKDFQTARAKLQRTFGNSQTATASKDPKAASPVAPAARSMSETPILEWSGNCVP